MAHIETRRRGRPSKEKRDTALKETLLVAALEVFGDKGFDGASLAMIADRAGADTALSRYYFGSKLGLWQASIDFLTSQFRAELQDALLSAPESVSERLKTAIRWFVHMSAAHPYLTRIIVFEGGSDTERAAYIAEKVIRPFYDRMSELIEEAKKSELVPDVETRTIFFMITHGGSFPMSMPDLTNAFPGGNIKSKKAVERHAEALINLIVREKT